MHSRPYPPRHRAASALPADDMGTARSTVRRAALSLAGTIGVAAVVTSALAAPADAAPSYRVWDRVAKCESGNRWHVSTGNGYYGGVQFSSSTWRAYGGHKYAHQASGASRLEQIEVARRVLASQGPGAWPVCGPRAGLTRHSGLATHATLPKVAGQSAGVTHKSTAHKSTAHKSTAHKSTAHKSTAHKSTAHKAKPKSRAHQSKTYRVRSGDTLHHIAAKQRVRGGWKALYHANRSHLHSPNVIRVGQVLRLP